MAYLDKINVKGTEYDIQDSKAARQTEVDELKSVIGYSPNLIQLTDKVETINGMTYTSDAESGTIIANGTSTNSWSKIAIFRLNSTEDEIYFLSGCPSGGTDDTTNPTYQIAVWDNTQNAYAGIDGGNGVTINAISGHSYTIMIQFGRLRTANNLVFMPVLKKDSGANSIVNPISILTLGGKNDGSEDIGAIINRYTDRSAIYLPTGKYLVTTPIVLRNSLFGENSIRYANASVGDRICTLIISGLTSGNLIETDSDSGNSITISDVNIRCNGDEAAICAKTNPRLRIQNVAIDNLGNAKGIYTYGTSSRHVYIDNVSIRADQNKMSVGIDLSSTIDCRIDNTEIMFCQVGIILGGLHYMSNTHIWTGSNNEITKEWYDETKAIVCNGNALVFATNLFVDSAYELLYFKTGGRLWATNLMVWDDNTGSAFESNIYLTQKEGTAYLYVNGGCYNGGRRINVSQESTNVFTNFISV